MAQLIADRRDIDFVIHEQFGLSSHKKFKAFNRKTVDLIITEARNLAVKEFLPTQKSGDEEGCRFENGRVRVPDCFHRPHKLFLEGEWLAMNDDPEVGGQGMPRPVALGAAEYFNGANVSLMLYYGLTQGAARLVQALGSDEQRALYMEKLFTGEWTGTMVLTEPEAGSDVGALAAAAKRNADGTYSITGSKIFISGGEHDLTENIIHPVLARIEGAPAGTSGISLFLVPKYRVNADGSLGEFNDVVCTGIEEKMGLHGNATCSLSFGGNSDCIGTLVGEENSGMAGMFFMMNEARCFVGFQGFAVSTTAYMHALEYARTRIQGRHLLSGKDASAPGVPIIRHPDVRRQLLTMKAYVEGMRSLIYYNAKVLDDMEIAENPAERERLSGMAEVLTPIVKGYCTDRTFEITSQAVQVYGGYGVVREFPAEQLLRDCRVFMIYEGTNGIQAMDLLGRKLAMKKGQVFTDFLAEIDKTIASAGKVPGIEHLAEVVDEVAGRTVMITGKLATASRSEKVLEVFSAAHPFLDVVGDLVMGWMLLWRASVAAPRLRKIAGSLEPADVAKAAEKNRDAAFYEGQLKTAEFFIETILPVTLGKLNAIERLNGAAVYIPEISFGG